MNQKAIILHTFGVQVDMSRQAGKRSLEFRRQAGSDLTGLARVRPFRSGGLLCTDARTDFPAFFAWRSNRRAAGN